MRAADEGVVTGQAALAQAFNVSSRTIQNWIEQGMPCLERGAKGKAWKFDRNACAIWRQDNARPAKSANKAEYETRKVIADAVRAETKALAELKQYVAIETVEDHLSKVFGAFRARVLAIPPKLAPILANEIEPTETRRILKAAIDEALNELADCRGVD